MRSQIVLNYTGTGEPTQATTDKIYQGQVAETEYTLNVSDKTWLQTDQVFIAFTRPTSPATSKNFIMSPAGAGIWKWISNGWETAVTDSELNTSTTLKVNFICRRKSTVNPALYTDKTTAEIELSIQPSSAYSPLEIDESDATTIINLLLAKMDRYDFADSGYATNGYKADRAVYTDFSATIDSSVLTGSLLVFAVTAGSVRTQSEYFFVGRELYSRTITIDGETITVGDWGTIAITQALLDRISALEADNATNKGDISTLKSDNTTNKSNISALQTDNTTNKANISVLTTNDNKENELSHTIYDWVYSETKTATGEWQYIGIITVPDDITEEDIKKYGLWVDLSYALGLSSPTIDTKIWIEAYIRTNSGIQFFDNLYPVVICFNYAGHDFAGAIVYPNKLAGGIGGMPLQIRWSSGTTFYAMNGHQYAVNAGYHNLRGFMSAEDKTKLDGIDMSTKADLVDGKVPSSQLPSYVDDAVETYIVGSTPFASDWLSETEGGSPLIPEKSIIYTVLTSGTYENHTFRWGGSAYIELDPVNLSNYYNKTETNDLLAEKEPKFPAPTTTNKQYLYYENGERFVGDIVIGGGSSAATIYLTNNISTTVGTYKELSYNLPSAETIVTKTLSAATSPALIETYIFDDEFGNDIIDAGKWTIAFKGFVNSASNITYLRAVVFTRAINGTETTLFTMNGADINNTTIENIVLETIESGYVVDPTVKLGCRIYAVTDKTSDVTVTYYKGNGNAAYINTPLALRHTQLRDINGDSNYQHLTIAQIATFTNKQDKSLIFTNTSVLTSAFVADSTYSALGYYYRASIALTGVTASDFADVVPSAVDILSGNYLANNETYSGGVYIYAKTAPTDNMTIPTIIVTKGA